MQPGKNSTRVRSKLRQALLVIVAMSLLPLARAQSTATLQGRVVDQAGAVLPGVKITVYHQAIGLERVAQTDSEGAYQIAALPVGDYRVEVQAPGFETHGVEKLTIEVGRTVLRDFQLNVGEVLQQVIVTHDASLIERTTTSVGQTIDRRRVQEMPLNGRHFLDLGLLIPGSVTPPQNGLLSQPLRGQGSLALNTAGGREDTVNFMINGINVNVLTSNQINLQPSISTVQEFKADNSTFSAEYGHSSGAVINIATRAGANEFHGELFEFLRNDALDARNFFDFTSSEPPPFKRNQFGGYLGGPIVKNRAFFFLSYEGLRQRQDLSLNSQVLSDAERSSVTDPVIVKLLDLIPRANFADRQGSARFVGSASAPVDLDQWTIDINHNLGTNDQLHGYYAFQKSTNDEPNRTGNTIPGFGDIRKRRHQIFTLNETHSFGPNLVNEARFGVNRFYITNTPKAQLNPADFGINNGVRESEGLPQLNIAGGLNFGGPVNLPAVRASTTFFASDTASYLRGAHSLKFGGELLTFFTNSITRDAGIFNFPTVAAFIAGTANSFSVTLGDRSSSIAQRSLGLFVQDNYRWRPNLTLELGLRYELNTTPTERYDRFVVFDPATASLLRVGTDIDQIYRTNNKNFQPRLGFAWDPFKDGRTSVRAAYAILVDQPITNVVIGTSANPPRANPLTYTGAIRLDNAVNMARAVGLAPQTVDHGFEDGYVQTWNLNVQRELLPDLAVMVGYFGSKGTNLRIQRNINQPVTGVRPYAALSESSPILPGAPLANITQFESTGNSTYNALWVSANRRLSRGLQLNASYAWSKSLDYNSLSTQGVVVQNSYDLRNSRGRSDFDAGHRFVCNAIYELPFKGNRLIAGWQVVAIVQSQGGNPVNLITANSTVNGVANTLRPDVTGPIEILGNVDRWFDTSVFTPVARFGNLGRNVVSGPRFDNADFSVVKNTKIGETVSVQFRAEFFDLFNHANFGQPGRVVGSNTLGQITSTRFPTGDSGSSRQVQLAVKFNFHAKVR
jgi:hypothetical protein